MNQNYITKELTKNGLEVMKYKGFFLHSKYDPIKEAKRFIDENYKKATVQVLIGYASGYIYEELKKRISEDEKIIVVDPLNNDLEIKNFLSRFEEEEIKIFLNNTITILDTLNVIVSINYEKVVKDYKGFNVFMKLLKEKNIENKILENTINFFDGKWMQNYLNNLKYISQDHSVKSLANLGSFPIVIASGGPSLTKQISLLKKYRSKIILIAAGTTINSLLLNNVEPDLVVSIDGGEVNHQHFKDLKINKYPLAYLTSSHYGVRESFEKGYYFLSKGDEKITDHLSKFNKEEPSFLLGGGSVANFAYELALHMTTGPITLIGQDLAYTNGKAHAEGNLNKTDISKKEIVLAEGYYGEEVETDYVFLNMKNAFVKINNYYDAQQQSYNSTEGGLEINCFNKISFKQFLENYAIKECELDLNIMCNEFNQESYFINLKKEINLHEELINFINQSIKELNKNISKTEFKQSILKKLDKLDKKIQKTVNQTNLLNAFTLLNLNIHKYFKVPEKSTPQEIYSITFKQNVFLYSELKRITENSLNVLKELIKQEEKKIG